MKIIVGSDHAGYNLKIELAKYLVNKGYEVIDVGCNSTDSCNYPEFGKKVGEMAVKEKCFGVAVCGSGIGISMAANKAHGARAVNCNTLDQAEMSRRHNDANVICFGERFVNETDAKAMLDKFLSTSFEGGRHQIRVDMLDKE